MNRVAEQPDRAGQHRQQQLDQAGSAQAGRADHRRTVRRPPVAGIVTGDRKGKSRRGIPQPQGLVHPARMTTSPASGQTRSHTGLAIPDRLLANRGIGLRPRALTWPAGCPWGLRGAQVPGGRGSARLVQRVLLTVNGPVMPFWACPGDRAQVVVGAGGGGRDRVGLGRRCRRSGQPGGYRQHC